MLRLGWPTSWPRRLSIPTRTPTPARVECYAGIFDALPPAVVFETPEGLTLVDGYDLVAAARRLRLETVEAEVSPGSPRDAPRYARYAAPAGAERGPPSC